MMAGVFYFTEIIAPVLPSCIFVFISERAGFRYLVEALTVLLSNKVKLVERILLPLCWMILFCLPIDNNSSKKCKIN
ncbi:hypothetical protein OIU77_028706 [Salix suchowensis]|uniref:Uncharacterized protein n=1 Tax=Salix suchowensis TaxID=1278906 RepID=A0ABQ9BLI9_9ROSI|nr:hypothetical protein OIU77_028706 [Salix suchowensis]